VTLVLRTFLVALLVEMVTTGASAARAETISGALTRAYLNNPEFNQQRAAVRATDESVPQAKSGWLPKINGSADDGPQYSVTGGGPTAPAKQTSGLRKPSSTGNAPPIP
jgi:outer membrane protein